MRDNEVITTATSVWTMTIEGRNRFGQHGAWLPVADVDAIVREPYELALVSGGSETPLKHVPRSPAAQRMRLHRQRRRDGRRWLSIEIWETEIDALIGKGLLKADARNDSQAVREGLYLFLDGTLGRKP
jgi:hypothetical protein